MDQLSFLDLEEDVNTSMFLAVEDDSNSTSEQNEADTNFVLILFSISVIVSTFTLVGNTLILAVYLRFRFLRKVHNDFVVSLTVANFLVGLAGPYIMLRRLQFLNSQPLNFSECLFRLILTMLVVSCSACNLCAATADRYVAIMYPLRYTNIVTRRRTRTVIVALWGYNAAFCIVQAFGLHNRTATMCNFRVFDPLYGHIQGLLNICIPILASIALYIPIFITTRRHMKEILLQPIIAPSTTLHSNVNRKVVQEAKMAITTGLILGGFVLCWLPILVFPYVGPYIFQNILGITKFNSIAILLSFSHSALCPIIYGWRNREIRVALKRMMTEIHDWEFWNTNNKVSDVGRTSRWREWGALSANLSIRRSSYQKIICLLSPKAIPKEEDAIPAGVALQTPSTSLESLASIHDESLQYSPV